MEVLPKLLPINIIITSFNRLLFLKKTIESILFNTVYPYKIFVVDNNSTDGSREYLKTCKVEGKIFDYLFLETNYGQSIALNKAFKWMQEWDKRRPSDDLFITTNDDILVPELQPCWRTNLKHLFDKYEQSHQVGGLFMRIERMARTDINEEEELTRIYKGCVSVYRMLRRSDMEKLGDTPFSKLKHWDGNSMGTTMQTQLQKKYYMTTHLYASHIGYTENKGFEKGFTQYHTYAGEHKDTQHLDKPYPIIHPKTFVPLKVNHNSDKPEQILREEYWTNYVDFEDKKEDNELLKEYINGVTLDLSSGDYKLEGTTSIDYYPFDNVDIVNPIDDLWMFEKNSIDNIISVRGLNVVADIKKTLKEWDRVLKKDGHLYLIINNNHKNIIKKSYKNIFSNHVINSLLTDYLGYKILLVDYPMGNNNENIKLIAIKL